MLHDRTVDIGASYLTAEQGSPFAAVVHGWVDRGLARPWTDTFAVAGPEGLRSTTTGPVRYAAPGGLRSLVADLASGLDVESGRTVAAVGPGPRVDDEDVPAAVLAMPDPQARRLLDPATAGRLLDDRPWEPSLAVVLGWSERRWPADLHGAFVHDDPAVTWVADDGDRRGDGAPVLVAHTTAELAAAHLEDPDAATRPVAAGVGRRHRRLRRRVVGAVPGGERLDLGHGARPSPARGGLSRPGAPATPSTARTRVGRGPQPARPDATGCELSSARNCPQRT